MIKNPLNRLYYLAGGAFLFALIKYVFITSVELSPKFFIIEFISFGLFLALVYFFDRLVRESKKEQEIANALLLDTQSKAEGKITELENSIVELKSINDIGYNSNDEFNTLINYISSDLVKVKDISESANSLLISLAKEFNIGLGVCYLYDKPSQKYVVKGTYGLGLEISPKDFIEGEGLNGQAIKDKTNIVLEEIDEDYFNVESCSGSSKPKFIYLLPLTKDGDSIGLIEVASFASLDIEKQWYKLNEHIAKAMSL